MRSASDGGNNDKERLMWLAAIQLVSGRRWQDNREQIAAELALLPSERPLLVLLPENFALFGERQGYLDGAESIGEGPIQRQLAEWARDYGIWLVAGPCRPPSPVPTISTPVPWCSTPAASARATTTRSTCSMWTWRTITVLPGIGNLQPRRGACAGGLPVWSPRPLDLL